MVDDKQAFAHSGEGGVMDTTAALHECAELREQLAVALRERDEARHAAVRLAGLEWRITNQLSLPSWDEAQSKAREWAK